MVEERRSEALERRAVDGATLVRERGARRFHDLRTQLVRIGGGDRDEKVSPSFESNRLRD